MKKTLVDHLFDMMLIFAPCVMMLRIDANLKSLLMFYLCYLPYLTYMMHKEVIKHQHRRVKRKEIQPHQVKEKKEEMVLVP